MIKFHIDTNCKTAVYRQLETEVVSAVRNGLLKSGEQLPSMNELAETLGISKETVKRAYGTLRDKGIIEPQQGKGFYVTEQSGKNSISVLFLFDKFSIYKQEIVRGFHQELKCRSEDTILLFNQDINVFEFFINEHLGKHDFYIVSPHFSLDAPTQRKAEKLVRRIPNHKLIMIDHWLSNIPGNYGAAYQDFENDAYEGLQKGWHKSRKTNRLRVITLPSSLYGSLITIPVTRFAEEKGISLEFIYETPRQIERGDVFLVLNGQLDLGLIDLVDKAQELNLKVGEDFFIISYNDSPIDKVVLNGLTTISTDFVKMGEEAARMINEKRMRKIHIPFNMNHRMTF
ncbi:MAG: GntR family transcriptional regulator [Candidatus Cryptobacteroides sp.]